MQQRQKWTKEQSNKQTKKNYEEETTDEQQQQQQQRQQHEENKDHPNDAFRWCECFVPQIQFPVCSVLSASIERANISLDIEIICY